MYIFDTNLITVAAERSSTTNIHQFHKFLMPIISTDNPSRVYRNSADGKMKYRAALVGCRWQPNKIWCARMTFDFERPVKAIFCEHKCLKRSWLCLLLKKQQLQRSWNNETFWVTYLTVLPNRVSHLFQTETQHPDVAERSSDFKRKRQQMMSKFEFLVKIPREQLLVTHFECDESLFWQQSNQNTGSHVQI